MHDEDRRRESRKSILRGWVLMAKIFAGLMPPIQLPMPEPGGLMALEDAAHRARVLVKDLPLDGETITTLDLILIEWLTAMTLMRHDSSEHPDFTDEAVVATMIRHAILCEKIGDQFNWFEME